MRDAETSSAGEPDPPVLTDVAVPGDRARDHGVDLGPGRHAAEPEDAHQDAEHYLSERIRAAVAQTLPDAVRHAAGDGRRRNDGRTPDD